jgi:hypothetical protein
MIWPPTRRVSSGNDADTSLAWMAGGAGVGSGEGETCGKARLGSVGLGSAGSPADGSTPSGRVAPGSIPGASTPTPGVVAVPAGVVPGAEAAATGTLPDAETAAAACGEVPVAVRVIVVPAAFCGTATAARSWTGWAPAVRATEHDVPPGDAQTVKLGASVPGFAVMLTFALPLTPLDSQTQIA